MKKRPSGLVFGLLMMLASTNNLFGDTSHDTGASTITQTKASAIKAAIEKHREWSAGHSPVPRRAITSKTFKKVMKTIDPEDADALTILLFDDAYDVRSIAASLLGCIDPNAQTNIEQRMKNESDNKRRNSLSDSLIEFKVINASGTSCK